MISSATTMVFQQLLFPHTPTDHRVHSHIHTVHPLFIDPNPYQSWSPQAQTHHRLLHVGRHRVPGHLPHSPLLPPIRQKRRPQYRRHHGLPQSKSIPHSTRLQWSFSDRSLSLYIAHRIEHTNDPHELMCIQQLLFASVHDPLLSSLLSVFAFSYQKLYTAMV